jgi:hypothetical protein
MDLKQLTQKYTDILSQNSLKGNTYYIKFKNDPTFYLGIPMLRSSFSRHTDNVFTVNIFEPAEKSGISQRLVNEIEFLEPR